MIRFFSLLLILFAIPVWAHVADDYEDHDLPRHRALCDFYLTDAQLADHYIKFSIPGYYGPSELRNLMNPTNVFRQLPTRKEQVFKLVQERLDLLGRKPPPAPGTILDRLVIVTHQDPKLQATTSALLGSRDFKDTPSLVLTDSTFTVEDRNLSREATYFAISHQGELRRPISAKETIFVGGYSNMCLSRTVAGVIKAAHAAGLTEMTVRFLPDYIYEVESHHVIPSSPLREIARNKALDEKGFIKFLGQRLLNESLLVEPVPGTFQITETELKMRYTNLRLNINVVIEKPN